MAKTKDPTELGTLPIPHLLKNYALPAIAASIAASLYNIADSIFIGQGVGPFAIAGLALTFPLMNITAAFGSLIGAGASAMISIKFGEKDYYSANKIFGNVLSLNLILGILIGVLGFVFLDPILRFFGASDNTLSYARDYMQVIMIGNVFTHLYFGLNAIIRSSGFPLLSMNFTIASVLLNCLFTPLFIYQFHWGIQGAAIGTIVAQVIPLIGQFLHFRKKGSLLQLHKNTLSLGWKYIKNIFAIGLSPFFMNLAACTVVIFINWELKKNSGDLAIGAYGILNRVLVLFEMIIFGINQGMQPIAGYNYGAKRYIRVRQVTSLSIIYATLISTTGFIICLFFPHAIASIFTTDKELIDLTATGLQIAFLSFPLVGCQMVGTNLFTSINKARIAILLSLSRQLIILIPALLLLSHFYGIKGVWFSMPLSDAIAFIFTMIVLVHQMKKLKQTETTTPSPSKDE